MNVSQHAGELRRASSKSSFPLTRSMVRSSQKRAVDSLPVPLPTAKKQKRSPKPKKQKRATIRDGDGDFGLLEDLFQVDWRHGPWRRVGSELPRFHDMKRPVLLASYLEVVPLSSSYHGAATVECSTNRFPPAVSPAGGSPCDKVLAARGRESARCTVDSTECVSFCA